MNKKLLLGVGIIILVAISIFALNSSATGKATQENIIEFNVDAFQYGYSPDVITVNQGDYVRINIDNTDTLHGIRFQELGVAGMDSVEFVADKKGEFIWYCNNFCGEGHMAMQGKLIVK